MNDWAMFHDWMLADLRGRPPARDVFAEAAYGRRVWPIGPVVADEIERLTGLLDGRTVSCSQCNAAAEREATLCALLTEARKWVADWYDLTPTMVEPVLARIDAALDGGAPCATCDGTGQIREPIDVLGVVHGSTWMPCPDCGADPLAQLFCRMWDELSIHDGRWTYEVEAFAPEAAWLRKRVPGIDALIVGDRDELLAALGGGEDA